MKELVELISDLTLNYQRSPWAQKQEVLGWLKSLEGEVAELRKEIEAGFVVDAAHELGDVLWNVVSLMIAFQDHHGLSLETISRWAREKLRRRKPWIFDGRVIDFDADGEHELFTAQKARVG